MPDLVWHLGTMGYGYKDWEGVFYPPGMRSRDYLLRYSRVFNAVEIDTTFYGIPRPGTVTRWVGMTPLGFIFCPKVPRQITHDERLTGASSTMVEFLSVMRLFGDRLGPILIQLPPDFTRMEINALAAFLPTLPSDLRFAVEFRHRSWHVRETGELLQAYDICWTSTEYHYLPHRIYVTADFAYVRWIGRHGTYEHHDHERIDRLPKLQTWWEDIQARREDGLQQIFGFFNNDYAGFAPATCQRFKQLAGLPTEPLAPPQQGRLL